MDEQFQAHIPVMPQEVIKWLEPQAGEVYLDGTLGLGGHARLISDILGTDGTVLGLDRDRNALARATLRLSEGPARFIPLHSPYSRMDEAAGGAGFSAVDRIMLDIGVSSMQLDEAERGFSFMREGPLDMRMDDTQTLTAQEVVMCWPERELARIFREYGEERFSEKVARIVAEERSQRPIKSTVCLAEIVARAIPRRGKIHPATRVFQALRIAVNDELGELERGIGAAVRLLRPGGRLALITFHSLEDRLAKWRFRALAAEGVVRLPCKKVIKPAYAECRVNRRARSAKLRILEKCWRSECAGE